MTYRTDQTGRDDRVPTSNASIHHEFDILGSVPVGVLVLRADASIVYANPAAHALFESGSRTPTLIDTLCPIDGQELSDHLRDAGQFEAIVAAPHSHRQVMVRVAERSAGREPEFVVSLTDITALKQATERAEFLAHHDPLTRLSNRTLLQSVWDVLEERLATGSTEVHAMALDLDRFKEINDAHGHGTGDLVLRQAALRLRLTVGDAGHVFRFGGDEFFVLIDGVPRETAIEIGHRIVADLGRPMIVLGNEMTIGCSVGIASAPLDGIGRDALHRAADMALYDVKRNGRGDVACFDPKQEQALLDHRLLQTDLVLAIANGGLGLALRAPGDAQGGSAGAAYAAVSWANSRIGRDMQAHELHALARETGLCPLLDLWTLRTGIARFVETRGEGAVCSTLSVRVSAPTLIRDGTVELVLRALHEQGMRADELEIRVTERSLLEGGESVARTMRRLKENGVRLAIDEFGTSLPDLHYLRSLGVVRLAFDREVTTRILDSEDAEALLAPLRPQCSRLGIELALDDGYRSQPDGKSVPSDRVGDYAA